MPSQRYVKITEHSVNLVDGHVRSVEVASSNLAVPTKFGGVGK